MIAAKKDSTNPHYKSRYADLASIWEACCAPLADNQLAVVQNIISEKIDGNLDECEMFLETKLIHSSGQWFSSKMKLILGFKKDMQALGSALTYARRYSLAALVGVVQDDDDGNSCSKIESVDNKKLSQKKENTQQLSDKKENISDVILHLKRITDGYKNRKRTDWIKKTFGIKEPSQLDKMEQNKKDDFLSLNEEEIDRLIVE